MLRAALGVALFCLGALCYALLGILSQLSKSPDGSYGYSLPSVVLLAEFTKLCFSVGFLLAEDLSPQQALKDVVGKSGWSWLAFALPSVLYSLNNNLDMLNNQHMDPATEQVLVQGKILTTGLVWWWVFGHTLGPRKWCSLVLLFAGTVSAGWPRESEGKREHMHIDTVGVFLVMIYVWVSASAGVYNEWLYKGVGKDESIHVCNIRLYIIGCAVNLAAHLAHHPLGSLLTLTAGYNRYCWALVATYSLMGLLIAQVMKFFDSIVKLFISGSSMYVSAVLSWAIFGYAPTWNFLAGMALVTVAMALYNFERIEALLKAKTA
ncbi:unnamed protein product [Effrenium voratum]|nr:unnamed protein product [Effrenium voratum]